jgi:TolA-binding protein
MRTFASSAATRRLSSARLELVSARRLRIGLQSAVLVALLALLGTLALHNYANGGTSTSSLRDLQARSIALEAEGARLRTELAMERATRSSLEQQIVALNERIVELSGQIDFRNAQRDRQRATQ